MSNYTNGFGGPGYANGMDVQAIEDDGVVVEEEVHLVHENENGQNDDDSVSSSSSHHHSTAEGVPGSSSAAATTPAAAARTPATKRKITKVCNIPISRVSALMRSVPKLTTMKNDAIAVMAQATVSVTIDGTISFQ